ncbi:hypothetical protein KFK09_020074 [Dendrobium nobile]|uniref:Uncharacterized protein n=1 Tax=Dendrobium nobile TaxID=94219 RepID=A0A8T3ATZ1_DENNO|nr:hypothetical protein KFK09_020074 [Dendrobium nobile]
MATLGPEFIISYAMKKQYKEKMMAMEEDKGAEKGEFREEKRPKRKGSSLGWMKKKVHPTRREKAMWGIRTRGMEQALEMQARREKAM